MELGTANRMHGRRYRLGRRRLIWLVALIVCGCWFSPPVCLSDQPNDLSRVPGEAAVDLAIAERGYRRILDQPYLPPDFDQETFDEVWRGWPAKLRDRAAKLDVQGRRALAFERYGLTPRPDNPGKPLQYVVDEHGQWTMNCFSCHGGEVVGQVYPGAPNRKFALSVLTSEIRATKLRLGKPLARMDIGSLVIPLGETTGTTNAVMFGVVLMHLRDADLNVHREHGLPPMVHHDMDAPAWWNFHKRPRWYIDGFAQSGHRGLMQFALVEENDGAKFREWEPGLREIHAYLQSLRPPTYPDPIDRDLAAEGARVYAAHCSECHGVYRQQGGRIEHDYPSRRVPLKVVGTDHVRLTALTPTARELYAESWFAEYGRQETVTDPEGYVAPPLDGIWASAPYFHNGSVPTLWHVLNPAERPIVWKPLEEGYDGERVGLKFDAVDRIPASETDIAARRRYFDTRRFGKSAAGHDFGAALDANEQRSVLEFLKTL
jgi:hypothetical protein